MRNNIFALAFLPTCLSVILHLLFLTAAFGIENDSNKTIILIGPPCAGKTTYAQKLEKLGYYHIYPSGILRQMLSENHSIALQYKPQIMHGQGTIPSEVIESLVKESILKVLSTKPKTHFIIDGFPRSIRQAEFLKLLLKEHKLDKAVQVVFLNVEQQILIERSQSRLECPKCRKVHALRDNENTKAQKCEACDIPVEPRSMDQLGMFMIRLKFFEEWSKPVLEYYQQEGLLKSYTNNDQLPALL
jgi:adenylate kinase